MISNPLRHTLRVFLLLAGWAGATDGLALPPADVPTDESGASPQHSHLGYDQLSARVPRALAPIASVAVARINIELHRARQLAGQRLCPGQWSPQGPLLLEVGPFMPSSEGADEQHSSWVYQSFRHPQAIRCGDISRLLFFQELSRHLPEWITVRPGGQATSFRRGIPMASN